MVALGVYMCVCGSGEQLRPVTVSYRAIQIGLRRGFERYLSGSVDIP